MKEVVTPCYARVGGRTTVLYEQYGRLVELGPVTQRIDLGPVTCHRPMPAWEFDHLLRNHQRSNTVWAHVLRSAPWGEFVTGSVWYSTAERTHEPHKRMLARIADVGVHYALVEYYQFDKVGRHEYVYNADNLRFWYDWEPRTLHDWRLAALRGGIR